MLFHGCPSAPKLVLRLSTQNNCCVQVFPVTTSGRNPGCLQGDLSVLPVSDSVSDASPASGNALKQPVCRFWRSLKGSKPVLISVSLQNEAPSSEPVYPRTLDSISITVFPCCDGAGRHDIRGKTQKSMRSRKEIGLKGSPNRIQISQDHRTRWEISFPDTNFRIKVNRSDLDSQRSPAAISSEPKDGGQFVPDLQMQEATLRKTFPGNEVVPAKKDAGVYQTEPLSLSLMDS
eukprot:c23508_g1_i2 orf=219-917(+)